VWSPGWEPTRPRSNPIGIDRVLRRGLSPVETEQCVRVCLGGLGSELLSRRVPDSWTASSAFERAVGVGAHFESYMTGQCFWHSSKKKEKKEEHRGRHAPYGGAAQAHRHISEQAETRCGLAGVAALCIAKDVSFP